MQSDITREVSPKKQADELEDSSTSTNMSMANRPISIDEFIGQADLRENLKIFVEAAKKRGEPMDHVLFFGPPGLGKTTLAQIISHELGVGFKGTAGPVISKSGDLAAILTNLQPHDVLFIDEIHRLSPAIEEILYPAMEDGHLDIVIGEGPAARTVRIELPPFTLVGATTRSGLLTTPLRERFGIPLRLNFYDIESLSKIVKRNANILNLKITTDGANEIAKRSRGTPRIAVRLTRRVRDFAHISNLDNIVDAKIADDALKRLDIDNEGLDSMDRKYMHIIIEFYGGGPVGIDTISAALSEERDVLEDVIEPYLMQQGFVQRTPRGRIIANRGYKHLGIALPERANNDLFTNIEND